MWAVRYSESMEPPKRAVRREKTRPIPSSSAPRAAKSPGSIPPGYKYSNWDPDHDNHVVLLGTPTIDQYAEYNPRVLRQRAAGIKP